MPEQKQDAERWVLVSDVLDLIENFTPAAGVEPPSGYGVIVDWVYEAVFAMQDRPVPEDGRRVVLELHGEVADDLRYIETGRSVSAGEALRWAIGLAAIEALEREGIAQAMARKLHIDVVSAREYVEADRRGTGL